MNRKKVTPKDFSPLLDVVEKYTGKRNPDPRYKIKATNVALQNYYPFKKQVISFLVDFFAEDLSVLMKQGGISPLNQKANLKAYLSEIADFKVADLGKIKAISRENKEKILNLREYLRDIAFELNEHEKGALFFNIIFGLSTNIYLIMLALEKERNNDLNPFFNHCKTAACLTK
jgi:hypothetical protein